MQTMLQGDVTTIAYLWQVTRTDGWVLGFTTFDQDINYAGVTFEAATGLTNSANQSNSDLSVDNLEVTSFLESDAITEDDIRAGLYDGSDVELYLCDWTTALATAAGSQYYPGDFTSQMEQSLTWLLARQGAPAGAWTAAINSELAGFVAAAFVVDASLDDLPQTVFENIIFSGGANFVTSTGSGDAPQTLAGWCYNLKPGTAYRVDIYLKTDVFYYQGGVYPNPDGSWAMPVGSAGTAIAVLYPNSVAPPSTIGADFSVLPSGWIAHSNTGLGPKLTGYYAQFYSMTDIEYLQEDNIPVVVQDALHASCGSSVVPATGTVTVHILQDNAIAGPQLVFSSAQSSYEALPRSFDIPTTDPLYVENPAQSNQAPLADRSFIYDCALAIIAYTLSGNGLAAQNIILQLNAILDEPGFLANVILENAEDGSTARWTVTGSGTVSNIPASTAPAEPPYGTGQVIQFTATAADATFTYNPTLDDTTDIEVTFEHVETSAVGFVITVDVTTTSGDVTEIQATSSTGAASYNASTKVITVPIGAGNGAWRTTVLEVASLASSLASDTLTAITGFAVELTTTGSMNFDNLSCGVVQPAGSLSFSYDVFHGQQDQAYIRTGAMAWVLFAYAIYMEVTGDLTTPVAAAQQMVTFLLTLQSTAADLTNGMFYGGFGAYEDPGYQYVPGQQMFVSTEHQVDLYFAFKRLAPQLTLAGGSYATTATSIDSIADALGAAVISTLWISGSPGRFAQGVTGSTIDPSLACDASGTWAALFADAMGRDDLAKECLQFVYENFYLTDQTISESSATDSFNETYSETTAFSGFVNYADSSGGYTDAPASVSMEETWGMILALLRLYNVSAIQTYFASVVTGGINAFLTRMVGDQVTVRNVTANGSLVAYSLAARDLPWEFDVWPALTPTAWMWITLQYPTFLLATSNSGTGANPGVDAVLLRKGTLGQVKMKNGVFTAEFRGLAHKLTTVVGATYGPICRATFGSGLNGIDMNSHWKCMYNVTLVRETGSLASVTNARTLVPASGLTTTADWFNDGFITFTSGVLEGESLEIKSWDGTTLGLFLDLPELPAAGDTFNIEAGCDKTPATCQSKFSNIVNFQGENFIPGMDQLLDYASS